MSDTAATSLALLAILGAGENRLENRLTGRGNFGLQFLLSSRQADGCLVPRSAPDFHRQQALATLALAEAYSRTRKSTLGDVPQQAVDFLAASRHAARGEHARTWMLLAFDSARRAGLRAPSSSGLSAALAQYREPSDLTEWFFASLAAFRGGSSTWRPWLRRIRTDVLNTQRRDGAFCGSWDPTGPRRHEDRRVEATSLAALCAEIAHRSTHVVGIR